MAEETHNSHDSTPTAMLYAVFNAIFLGILLIVGMNFSVQGNIHSVLSSDDDGLQVKQAYTIIWEESVGERGSIFFLVLTLVAIAFSNCANLTSASRMVFAFSRDKALPLSRVWHHVDARFGGPVRGNLLIWLG